jgi:hypothetical protein
MDTDRELIQEWKIKRDISQRGKSLEGIKKEMERRHNDYMSYINTQKENADIIIHYYKSEILPFKCSCLLKSFDYNFIYILQMCDYEYNITPDRHLQIELKGDSNKMKKCMINMGILHNHIVDRIETEYNGEIQLIINYIKNHPSQVLTY